jgi:hypothetical protein
VADVGVLAAGARGAGEVPAMNPQVDVTSLPGSPRSAIALFLASTGRSATPVENKDSLATSEAHFGLSTVTPISQPDPP